MQAAHDRFRHGGWRKKPEEIDQFIIGHGREFRDGADIRQLRHAFARGYANGTDAPFADQ